MLIGQDEIASSARREAKWVVQAESVRVGTDHRQLNQPYSFGETFKKEQRTYIRGPYLSARIVDIRCRPEIPKRKQGRQKIMIWSTGGLVIAGSADGDIFQELSTSGGCT